ncbi:MAG: Mur ligase domain-containing protein, partial [Bacteroidia bacterium]|nr:Mur ligase domain-containing protein [Bacteroidia bacterium]
MFASLNNPSSRIYFLGIGGIGMSALAKYFKLQGHSVSGYDRSPSVVTKALES